MRWNEIQPDDFKFKLVYETRVQRYNDGYQG